MKTQFERFASLPLLLSFTAIAAAQVPTVAPPPVKMGLWESSVTVNTGMGAAGRASSSQSCYTAETWKQNMQRMQARGQKLNCTTSNFQQDSHQITFDGQCTMDQGMSVNYHIAMVLDSDTSVHGTTTSKVTGPMFPQGMTMTSAISSKFISSDCGALKPGESRDVRP